MTCSLAGEFAITRDGNEEKTGRPVQFEITSRPVLPSASG